MRGTVWTSLMTAAAAGVGSLGTDPASEWYESIEKPPWQPPPVAFPLVWTPLYAAIAYGTGRMVEQARSEERRGLLALTAADLVANAGWNWAFFRGRSPAGGLAVIVALNGLNVALVRRAAAVDDRAAAALAPYAAWVGFATALNASIWRRNR
ncbi:TspO/MBR family protein [Nocardioides sp. P5_C9_2]